MTSLSSAAPANSDVASPAGLCRAAFEMADRFLHSASLGKVHVRLTPPRGRLFTGVFLSELLIVQLVPTGDRAGPRYLAR